MITSLLAALTSSTAKARCPIPGRFCKLWDFLSNDSGLAGVGRFQVVHNGHKIEMVNTDDPSVDWDAISGFREVPDFKLSGNVRQILSEVYP